jgi:hypothetical protein
VKAAEVEDIQVRLAALERAAESAKQSAQSDGWSDDGAV